MNSLGKFMIALSVLLCASLAMAGSGRREGPVTSTPKVWGSNGSCQWGTNCPAVNGSGGISFDRVYEFQLGGTTYAVDPSLDSNYLLGVIGNFELGCVMEFGENGYIYGAAIHIPATGGGTQIANMWNIGGGAAIESKTFATTGPGADDETGWREQRFDTPRPVVAGTRYVISYTMDAVNDKRSTVTDPVFATVDLVNGNVTWPANQGLGNCVFAGRGLFPNSPAGGRHYYVEAMYSQEGPIGEVFTIDNGATGYVEVGVWSVFNGVGFEGDFAFKIAAGGASSATWTFDVTTPGTYRVSATWEEFTNRPTSVGYQVVDNASPLENVTVDQTVAPSDFTEGGVEWDDLGTYVFATSTVLVRLTDLTAPVGATVVADAIRVERISN